MNNFTYKNKIKRKRITQDEYDSFHNYNIESNINERERE